MNLLFEILSKLRNNELRSIKTLLKHSPFEYKRLELLFDLITRNKGKDEAFFSKKLYNSEPDNSFRVSKSRLKRIMEDSILHDKSLNKYSTEYINAYLQCRKKLFQAEILLGRGAYQASRNLIFNVIGNSKKYSLHKEEFQSKFLLHRTDVLNKTVKEFSKNTSELLELNKISFLVNESALLHYSITNVVTQKTLFDKEALGELGKNLSRMEEISKETESPLAKYYHLTSLVLLAQYQKDFSTALRGCQESLVLLKSEPSVNSDQRIANAHFQLSEISLKMGELEESKKSIGETKEFFTKTETNYLLILQTEFRVAFFSDDHDLASQIIQEAFSHPRIEVSKMREAIWHFYHACLLFNQKDLKEALRELNHCSPLLGDKLGWNISFRFLEIMVLSELNYPDLVESKVLNLKQFLKRTDKKSNLYRPMVLIAALVEWQKKGLDIKKAEKGVLKKLNQLKDFHDNFPFDPTSFELIRLENWLVNKIRSVS